MRLTIYLRTSFLIVCFDFPTAPLLAVGFFSSLGPPPLPSLLLILPLLVVLAPLRCQNISNPSATVLYLSTYSDIYSLLRKTNG